MAMIIDDDLHEFYFPDYGNTTTTTTTTTTTSASEDELCNWNDWSPLMDWEALSNGQDQDFRGLFESIMDDDNASLSQLHSSPELYQHPSPQLHEDSSPELVMINHDHEEILNNSEDTKGLRLVHLLMAAAEAMTGVNKSRDLARVILIRLKELVSPTQGTNMERLAAYFTQALQGLLEGAGSKNNNVLLSGPYNNRDEHQATDALAAFQLLQDMSPYVKFGHFTANQAILEAVANDKRVHIVDYDIMEGIQWASFMQSLVSRKDGPPSPHLRITALSRGGSGKRSITSVQETGRRLTAFAASIGQPFSFHQSKLDADESFKPSSLKLVRGEALIINCMLHLPHFSYRSPDSVVSFLSGAKTLNPRLVTLVEEEEEVGHTTDEGGFVGRFMESLHRYSALYDSLEAGFPMQGRARALVERVFLGPRIAGSLNRIYRDTERCSLGNYLSAVGFQRANISFANHCQAKLLLGLFNDGYRVEELASNKLVLGWKSRRLLSASIWTSPELDL
ncbi:Nodulation-signaling pathway 2 protein [Heracleum sosnowskyi]|uniref:Nodulation-signaling pathway 2 protein n=1 Tax=Heracleum sosnowskyi TaxID=360622 RepID=A0AAD8H965_9APIA|nr:Nodulation-signaling pathway 2 protein [Heracleum sosnowskyi]